MDGSSSSLLLILLIEILVIQLSFSVFLLQLLSCCVCVCVLQYSIKRVMESECLCHYNKPIKQQSTEVKFVLLNYGTNVVVCCLILNHLNCQKFTNLSGYQISMYN